MEHNFKLISAGENISKGTSGEEEGLGGNCNMPK